MANRIETAIKNVRDIPKIHPVDEYPAIPLYADRDGLWYLYTLFIQKSLQKFGFPIIENF